MHISEQNELKDYNLPLGSYSLSIGVWEVPKLFFRNNEIKKLLLEN
jgi:hypothetical protein